MARVKTSELEIKMSKDFIQDVRHKAVGQWVRLKGKTREGKTQIKEHGTRWLITEIRGASPVMPESFRLLIRSEKKTSEFNMIPDYELRWINPLDDKNFEVM